jgi:diphosphomevalonate decarboxylase
VSTPGTATAVAHANIALAKYWGKARDDENMPAVPSLSLTLAALSTRTRVGLEPDLAVDEVTLDGAPARDGARARVVRLLEEVRARAGSETRARVASANDFPTAAGLASSASGFAALAVAAARAYDLALDPEAESALARRASASAARSIYGGYVELRAGSEAATPVLAGDAFPLSMLVAVTARGPKSIGSTDGMRRTRETSPYYGAWHEAAPEVFERVKRAVLARDLEALGQAMEESALTMHASMMAARPAIVYPSPVTLAAMDAVRALRKAGTLAYYTMDAGPHVKVLVAPADAPSVERALSAVPGVETIIASQAGEGARLVDEVP